MWDLWWTKWYCDTFFSDHFGFPLYISFHRCSITRKRTKNCYHHIHHRVAQEVLRLRCVRGICCGDFTTKKKEEEEEDDEYGGLVELYRLGKTTENNVSQCKFAHHKSRIE
jgi:hypothetical protein